MQLFTPSATTLPPPSNSPRVAELSGIPPEDQVLLHAGTPLDDDEAVLGQSPLPEFTTLDLSTRLLGGNSGGDPQGER
uniref:Ubiquitin-like domain-containing protein n=1 Tax=Serinus canaria TaxID=9135 RepID=A0A8C9MG17_SERCA